MTRWPKDTQAARNAFYGDPGKGEIGSRMVPVTPPFAMYYEGKRVKAIQFHRLAAPSLLAALNEIWDYYEHDQKKIDAVGISKYAGAYNRRMVRGSSTKWSNHAYAAAIDLNAEENGLYAKGNIPQPVIDAFCRQGFMWGGWYKGRKDPMHFEAVDNGGRVPSSPRPVWPRPAAVGLLKDEPAVPADEMEEDAATSHGQQSTEIEVVQRRLKALGYLQVGKIDGKWGGSTAGAIAAFKNDRQLAGEPLIDAALKAALDEAEAEGFKRPISEERTSGEPEGSRIIAGAEKQGAVGTVTTAAGGIGIMAWLAEKFEAGKETIESLGPIISPFTDIIKSYWWVFAVAGGAYILINATKIRAARVEDAQTGKTP